MISPVGVWECGDGYCQPLQEIDFEAIFMPGPEIQKFINAEETETRLVQTGIFLLLRNNRPIRSYLCERDGLDRWLCSDLR